MSQPAPPPLRLAVLISGSGRTLENLIDRIAAGGLPARVEVVVASRGDVRGPRVAARAGLPVAVMPAAGRGAPDWSAEIFAACRRARADLVVMAGFLHLLPIPADFAGRVINIHPSLLPAFGGRGFHGMHVHRAVLARGCTVSGCTVHLVDDEYDHGRILLQRTVPVLGDDTPESLAARVFAAECEALPEAIGRLAAIASPRYLPGAEAAGFPAPRSASMPRSSGHCIADTLQLSMSYAERLLGGIAAARFARFARPGGVVVESNHPAFVYGHLSLYPPKILQQLEHPAPSVPPHFQDLFSKDAACRDDEDGDLYPAMDEILGFFQEGHRMLAAALRATPDAVLDRPNPAEGRMKELFPTLGSLQTFYCGGHMMMHLGQVSAWRRMENLGAA